MRDSDLNTDPYQMKSIYETASAATKKALSDKINEHFACGAPVRAAQGASLGCAGEDRMDVPE